VEVGGTPVDRVGRSAPLLVMRQVFSRLVAFAPPPPTSGAQLTYGLAEVLGRAAVRALDVDVRVTGMQNVPTSGRVLLASTHVSYPDFMFIQYAATSRRRRIRFMTRHDVWSKRRWAWPMDRMGHIPVDRAAPAGAYLMARRLLREEEAVCVFPEAGISYSFTVRSLMKGVASLARETGATVVPVALWGSQRIYSVGVPDEDGKEPPPDWTRGRRVDVSFGTPITVAADADLFAATTDLGHRLTAMLESLQALDHHRPASGEHAPWYPAHLGGHAPTRAQAAHLDVVPKAAIQPTWGPCGD
jgi:1-acyl-sn-glycerol-3-phosphate acyltransferase